MIWVQLFSLADVSVKNVSTLAASYRQYNKILSDIKQAQLMIKNKSIKRKIILTMSYTAVIVPTFLVALLAITYYYLGIERIFSAKISDSINDTVKVATLYLNEHNNNILLYCL